MLHSAAAVESSDVRPHPNPPCPALRPAVCVTHLHLDIKLSPTRLCELKGWALHWPDWLCKAGMQLEHDLTRIDSPNNNRIVVYIQLVVFVVHTACGVRFAMQRQSQQLLY